MRPKLPAIIEQPSRVFPGEQGELFPKEAEAINAEEVPFADLLSLPLLGRGSPNARCGSLQQDKSKGESAALTLMTENSPKRPWGFLLS
jgi:hypothetical protein